jgi:hypothetical protein
MKNITNNTEITRSTNGGMFLEVLGAMGVIYGSYEACKWAWDLGQKIGKKICG